MTLMPKNVDLAFLAARVRACRTDREAGDLLADECSCRTVRALAKQEGYEAHFTGLAGLPTVDDCLALARHIRSK